MRSTRNAGTSKASGQPVGAEIGKLARRKDELRKEVDDEDDPDDGARRLEERRQPMGQLQAEERQPDEAEEQERHLHPVLELLQDFEPLALDRLRGRGFRHVAPASGRRALLGVLHERLHLADLPFLGLDDLAAQFLGIALQASLMLVFDLKAERQADAYVEQIRRLIR